MAERTIEGSAQRAADDAQGGPARAARGQPVPGVAKKGGALPDLTLRREDVAIDRDHVAAYAAVCGFEPSQTLPFTYPHMLAFPLHMGIMTDGSFPYPAIGTVHVGNTITQHRPISPAERLDVSARAVDLRPHPKGKVFDLVTTVTSGGETVWESTSNYLRVGRGDDTAKAEGEPFDVVPGTGIVWRLPGNLGREYAAVSGDHNPIHLYPLTAKAFGFPRQIAHGMWSKARCVGRLRQPPARRRHGRGRVQEADPAARDGRLRVAHRSTAGSTSRSPGPRTARLTSSAGPGAA